MKRSTGRPRFVRTRVRPAPRPRLAPPPVARPIASGPRPEPTTVPPAAAPPVPLPHERAATVVRQIVVQERAKPRWGPLCAVARVVLGLQLLGGISAAIWPTTESRMPLATYVANSICTSSHPPRECQPDVPFSSVFGDFLAWTHGVGPG